MEISRGFKPQEKCAFTIVFIMISACTKQRKATSQSLLVPGAPGITEMTHIVVTPLR